MLKTLSYGWFSMSRNPPEVHKHGARKVTEKSVIRFCHRSETLLPSRSDALKFLLLSREKTVYFAKRIYSRAFLMARNAKFGNQTRSIT